VTPGQSSRAAASGARPLSASQFFGIDARPLPPAGSTAPGARHRSARDRDLRRDRAQPIAVL